jgi:hypothetical protein
MHAPAFPSIQARVNHGSHPKTGYPLTYAVAKEVRNMKTIEIFVVSVLRVILVFIARSSRTFPHQDFGWYRWITRVIYPVASAMCRITGL